MNRILFFATEEICHGILESCMSNMVTCLQNKGIQCDQIDCKRSKKAVIDELYQVLKKNKYDAAIAFNDTEIMNISTPDGVDIFDYYQIPFYNYIVDSPMGYDGYTNTRCKGYRIICVDRNHESILKKYFTGVQCVHFLPIGGIRILEKDIKPYKEREFDLVYYAGFEPKTLKEMLEYFYTKPEPVSKIMLNMIEYMIENRSFDEEQALRIVLNDIFHVHDPEDSDIAGILKLTIEAQLFMREYVREEVVRTLVSSPISLHLFGDGWQGRVGSGSGYTVFHDSFEYNALSGILNSSKIVLNVFPWFKNGTNERISSALLHKAAALSDRSEYLRILPDGMIHFYDIERISELPDIVQYMLDHEEEVKENIEKGYRYANLYFTWDHVVTKLISFIECDRETIG